jgi:hypothetical protein
MRVRNGAGKLRDALGESELAKRLVGQFVQRTMQPFGAARGVVRTAEDLGKTAMFVGRLTLPFEEYLPGPSAHGQARQAARSGFKYAQQALADPAATKNKVAEAGRQFRRNLDPTSSATGKTMEDEVVRSMNLGANQGQFAADVGLLFVGSPALKGLSRFPRSIDAFKAAEEARALRTPAQVARLAERYHGAGSHYVPQRLTEGFPSWIRDNPLFVYSPDISREEFYIRHAQLDPYYYGGSLPERGSWSAKEIGVQKLNRFDRISYGMPAPTRALLLDGAASATGSPFDFADKDELQRP